MADTITILDPLQFTKVDTADVYTIDGEGPAYEAVKTYAIVVPQDIAHVRVLINNNYDLSASRVHARVKSNASHGTEQQRHYEKREFPASGMDRRRRPGISGFRTYRPFPPPLWRTLHIDCAISGTTAHDGTEIIVQGRKETALAEWTDICRFVGPAGAATKSDCVGTTAAGQVVVGVTNPTSGNLNHVGKFIFIEDTAVISQCEIAYLTAQSGD